ncbi:dihydroorotate dehydrogenase (quinone) [Kibdelosporangium phytohabitans]|uniref:Dihydroorotate dehydrogenase (quinone) n=1 Tax=Kibdelosporangium phytohabitans TaxID=860235 RepID=A0A0N9IK48_9PSEU|nr:dihydroorotate dehydrogenase (quinone) [Kibdelosporangium phytohabitans]
MLARQHVGVYKLIRRALFRFGGGDAEVAHHRTTAILARTAPVLGPVRRVMNVAAPVTVFGVRFPNPVGLAAGMDKDGTALHAWPALGFGFVEVGTVTAIAQPGNPQPRLYRLVNSEAIINRMGFNNAGADALANRLLTGRKPAVPLGISIGKSKVVPVEEAVEDYRKSLRALYPHGDYFAVNVSSPNTPGLRGLQDRTALSELLAELTLECRALAERDRSAPRPLLVKIAPDLTDGAIAEVLEVCDEHGVSGVIATNTTLSRAGLAHADLHLADQVGGLSGRPLTERARDVVAFVHKQTGGKLPIIGVGGILDTDDATRMFDAGASLVQLYTGFIYRGPGLVRRISKSRR